MRYTSALPAINLDNIDEITPLEANVCPTDVDVRDSLSNHYSVLTAYYDKETKKWYEAKRASHSFISVNMTKIDPSRRNKCEDYSANLHLMADLGAMCSLLNYDAVRAMGINPEELELLNVSITGVNGKKLESQRRQMCVKIVNNKTGTESWEKFT